MGPSFPIRLLRRARAVALGWAILGWAILALAGCGGPTNGDVVKLNRPRVVALLEKLGTIGLAVDQTGALQQPVGGAPLSPPPRFASDPARTNLAVLLRSQLKEPEVVPPLGSVIDLSLYRDNDLRDALVYAGPKSLWGGAALDQDGRSFAEQCDRAMGIKYLLVVDQLSYDPPVAESDSVYTGGLARLKLALARIEGGEILGAATISLGPVDQVDFVVVKGGGRNDDPRERMTSWVYSKLCEEARSKASRWLNETFTGADVDLGAR